MRVLVVGIALAAIGCSSSSTPVLGNGPDASTEVPPPPPPKPDAEPEPDGTFETLTYNVAGLPAIISGGNPADNTKIISPLLNKYDLVTVQEDFSYHDELISQSDHEYKSDPSETSITNSLGDGLNRLSDFPFVDFQRYTWEKCNGIVDADNDCLTRKGFSVATHEIAPGLLLDVYNLHMDSGHDDGDIEARDEQVNQIIEEMLKRSQGRAIIVAGDTNMDERDVDQEKLAEWMDSVGIVDTCMELGCGDIERVDRILYRSSDALTLKASNWRIDEDFFDEDGEALSDHEAIGVTFDWYAN
jgi:hypothetical protein